MAFKLPENPRILVTRTDRIGDLVLTTPVFKALREKFPGAWIAALVFLEHREIVQGNPYLDEVILYDKKGSGGAFGDRASLPGGFAVKNSTSSSIVTGRTACIWPAGWPGSRCGSVTRAARRGL